MLRRALFLPLAALFLAGAVLYAAFGSLHTLLGVALVGCLLVSGCLFAVAGARSSVSVGGREIRWYVFAGVADVAVGVAMLLNAARMFDGGGEGAFLAVATGLSGVLLLFIGVDYLRGGRHLDVTVFE